MHTMDYKIVEITDEPTWEQCVAALRPHTFLQAWKWGLQYEYSGSKITRLGAYQDSQLVAVALLILVKARRGSFLLCPHGPLLMDGVSKKEVLSLLTQHAVGLAKKEKCDFIRFCPLLEKTEENTALFKSLGFRDAPIHMHPELSWLLDITESEDELLKGMRKTTRYLIKKSEKDGVTITTSSDPEDIALFWPVYQETVDRQHFTPFSKEYLKQEFELFAKDGQAVFFFGHYQGELISAAIILFYGNSAFYHHSGSTHKFEKINASYLLQWRVIQEAKKRGCELYNFWGIAPENRPKHPWVGLSLFKKGFGGFAEEYVHAQDKPISAKYGLNYLIETSRRIKRGV
jgi:peptidoglycan pentaglycine glycine transferase (the first glycine)